MKDVRCFEVYARLNVTETRFYFSIYLFHQRILFSLNIYHQKYIRECNMRPKLVEKSFISLLYRPNGFVTFNFIMKLSSTYTGFLIYYMELL